MDDPAWSVPFTVHLQLQQEARAQQVSNRCFDVCPVAGALSQAGLTVQHGASLICPTAHAAASASSLAGLVRGPMAANTQRRAAEQKALQLDDMA
jgi:hypothetical protein